MSSEGNDRIDLRRVIGLLRRGWWIIVACALLLGGAALALSLLQPKQYSATASLLFRDPGFDQQLFEGTFIGGSVDPDRQAATNVTLVGLTRVARQVAADLDVGLSADEVQAAVTVSPSGRSDVVDVMAIADDPNVAAQIANRFATEFIATRRAADQRTIRNAERKIQGQIMAIESGGQSGSTQNASSLRQRAEQLSVLASLQTGNAELVRESEPPDGPSSPRPRRNAAVGLFMGVLLGIGLVLLRARLDRRIRSADEFAEAFDRPLLASIPAAAGDLSDARPELGSRLEGAFSALWTSLRYFNVMRRIESVLVTSPKSGDGKSTVALNLAAAAARGGNRILLIEADLRRPSLARFVGGSSQAGGLAQVLAGEADLERVIVKVDAGGVGAAGVEPEDVDVLLAGSIPPNPADMLASERFRELLRDAFARYDLVVIDAPPTLVVPDAIPLLELVSAVIAVGRLDSTTREEAGKLTSQLALLDAPFVGVVANYTHDGDDGYYYSADRPKRGGRAAARA